MYRFSAGVLSDSDSGVSAYLYKNGVTTKVGGFADGETYEPATLTAVLSLTQGDEITIVNDDPDENIFGSANAYFTHFEGTLLTRT